MAEAGPQSGQLAIPPPVRTTVTSRRSTRISVRRHRFKVFPFEASRAPLVGARHSLWRVRALRTNVNDRPQALFAIAGAGNLRLPMPDREKGNGTSSLCLQFSPKGIAKVLNGPFKRLQFFSIPLCY
jgi:hypothetical protein